MEIISFGDLSTQVLECFSREDFSTAHLLMTNHGHRFPEERWHIDYWRMILAVLVGEGEAANPILNAAIDDGMWWPEHYLGQDEFKPHLDAALLEASYSRAEADRSCSSPRLLIHSGNPEPNFERLLFVIHRNHSDARRELANWLPAIPPGWTVALPQSSQLVGSNIHVWDDRVLAMQELAEHWRTLERKGMAATGTAIAGYVTGGDLAIRLALRQGIPGRFIALSPFVSELNETLQIQQQGTTPADLRGVITIGRLDSRCYSGALELAERLLSAGAAIDLRQLTNFTQGYPPNFSEVIEESLAYIFKNP